MKKIALAMATILTGGFAAFWAYENQSTTETISGSEETLELKFNFTADKDIRMEYASNPGARVNEDGSVDLLYEDQSESFSTGQGISHSEDGLDFEEGTPITFEEAGAFRSKQLPDGTWRSYGYNTTKGITGNCLTSQNSTDGTNFTEDEGCRYTLQEDDNGTLGVYDFFVDSNENVVLLYIGDLKGLNNVRRAYSTDNGWTFAFTNDNVLGDEELGGGANSFVDEKVFVLPDHRVFLIAMKKGSVYGFLSEDDGVSFEPFDEPLFTPEDFSIVDENIQALYDPQIVQLQDGRFRIYVAALINDETPGPSDGDKPVIVSATTIME